MKDDLKSAETLPIHEHIRFVDFDKFEDDVSGWELFDLETEKLNIDFERLSPNFVTVATLTPAYPHNGIGKGLSFADATYVSATPIDRGNGVRDDGYIRFRKDETGKTIGRPEVRIFYIDEYTGEYYVKLYLELLDSGPYEFALISKQKETSRRLVGPSDKVITLRIKNPDHLVCVLQQRPLGNEQMGHWRFFKAVVGRPLLSLKDIRK